MRLGTPPFTQLTLRKIGFRVAFVRSWLIFSFKGNDTLMPMIAIGAIALSALSRILI